MKNNLILVRFGEISLKGKETRKQFENILIKNIKTALKNNQIISEIKKERGRIYIIAEQISETTNVLKHVFGIVTFSPSIQIQTNMDLITDHAVKISKKFLTPSKTFAIRTTRTGEHNFTSQDVSIVVGREISKETKSNVNLTNPDFEIFMEIRDDKTFLFTEKIQGPGGMPLGTQGKILALIEKPTCLLAAWYLMKRGCNTVFANTNNSITGFIESFSKKWYNNFDIIQISSSNYDELEKYALDNDCIAVVTGDTLFEDDGGVIENLKILKNQISIPILHPLISMTKDDILQKCGEIGLSI